jgi:2-polyprenyl-3-methyl-5-hydroxy-6-metoxy-1,4-benzoquinol methylase
MTSLKRYPGTNEDRFRGSVSSALLAKMWKSQFNVDVTKFLHAEDIKLIPVVPHNYLKFAPVSSGDGEFYSNLMRRMGYDSETKPEFSEAASFIAPESMVLDVGCGMGAFSLKCPGSYCGIDTNRTAIEDGVTLGRNVRYGFVQDEAEGKYDVVTAFQVLEHVDDPVGFIQACINCLRPGGTIIISTPNMRGMTGYVPNEILNLPPHHLTWWDDSSLKSLIDGNNCNTCKIWYEPLQPTQYSNVLMALLWPRDDRHLVTSPLFPILRACVRIATRIAARIWHDVPFVFGQTIMAVAMKKQVN